MEGVSSSDERGALLLSPNLGSPLISSVAMSGVRPRFELVFLSLRDLGQEADPSALFDHIELRRSGSHALLTNQDEAAIPLAPVGPALAVDDVDSLGRPTGQEAFRRLVPRIGQQLLGGRQARLYALSVQPEQDLWDESLQWGLYDLAVRTGPSLRVNYHAIGLVSSFDGPFGFVHLTDLHVARRNDEMLSQVLQTAHGRSPEEIAASYRNFNDHLRLAVRKVNEMALRGEVSFAVITGDLVDFAHYGWSDDPSFDRVNWRTFIEIMTGTGRERDRENAGLAVPCFTTLGNHDWRLHPYDPAMGSSASTFGLEKEEAESVFYEGFSLDDLGGEQGTRIGAGQRMELRLLGKTRRQRLAKMATTKLYQWTQLGLQGTGLALAGWLGLSGGYSMAQAAAPLLINVASAAFHLVSKFVTSQVAAWLVDNPLHAAPQALASYFAWVSPYLEQVFFFGPHRFILVDTGPDLFVGQILEAKEWNRFKKMTLEDNILGGSPDSRAFVSDHSLEDWSQLEWLARALDMPGDPQGRTFLFLHAPPVNTKLGNEALEPFRESVRESKGLAPWVGRDELNLTYGTVAQFISQFFYLVLGTTEARARHGGVRARPGDSSGREGREQVRPAVDVIFCGHAHRNVEFRIGLEQSSQIRIFTDRYSEHLAEMDDEKVRADWWQTHRPLVAQTAATGPVGSNGPKPPYVRVVRLDGDGVVETFRVSSLQEE